MGGDIVGQGRAVVVIGRGGVFEACRWHGSRGSGSGEWGGEEEEGEVGWR